MYTMENDKKPKYKKTPLWAQILNDPITAFFGSLFLFVVFSGAFTVIAFIVMAIYRTLEFLLGF